MRYGNASVIGILSAGFALALASACGNSGNSSVFESGSGTLTGGTQTGGTMTGSTLTSSISGGTQSGGTITGGTSSGTGSLGGDACAAQASDSNSIPSDIFIMLDKSGSMNCPAADSNCEAPPMMLMHPTRWEAFTQAVQSFVTAPNSTLGIGIGYFSLNNNACSAAAYAMPTVAIAPLPGNANAITTAIGRLMPGGNTPTVPALTGAIDYARQYTMNTPGRTASVVFITDGIPNGCNSSVQGATTVAQMGFTGMPSIKTYVIGLGNTMALDAIALARTGGATHHFPAQADVATLLAPALTQISGAVTCDYTIPMGVDPKSVNISVALGGGMSQ